MRDSKGQFKGGKSGNPGGQTKDIAKMRLQMAREFAFICPEALKTVAELRFSEDENIRLKAAIEILNRGIGKPKEQVELSGQDGQPIKHSVILDTPLTKDEWDERYGKS